jgi:hypothetical protein
MNNTMLSTLLAVLYHESGRASVQAGATLAHSVGQAKPFTEWSDLRQEARMGREMTAKELLRRFEFAPVSAWLEPTTLAIENLAEVIHECERLAIDRGWTVIVLDPRRPWIPFSDLPEVAKTGRRNQAQFFLARFDVIAIA